MPAPETPPAQEPPKFVDESRFNQAMDEVKSLGTQLQQFTGMFTSMMGGQPQPQQAPAKQALPDIPDITDEDYEDALFKSDAKRIAVRMQAVATRAARDADAKWETRFTELEQRGLGALDSLSSEVNQGALNSMPYYTILKSDVDAALNTLPPHQRTPAMREHVYHAVVGKNLDKIDAHRAAQAAQLEKDRNAPAPSGRSSTSTQQGPTPSSVFGDDLLSQHATWKGGAAIWGKQSPDQWAQQRFGVSNIQEAAVYASNVMALDDCPQCFTPIVAGKCFCPARH